MGAPCSPGSVQLAGDLSAIASRTASDQRFPPGRDYWSAPRLDAGTLFRTDQCRLRQPDRLAAPYDIQLGDSAQYSGSLLALLTVGQTAGALLLPALARQEDRRQLLLLALALQLIGFCGFIWLPEHFSAPGLSPVVWDWAARFLGLVLALDHAGQPAVAGRLVAFMQGIGFIIAGLSPWLSGLLRSLSGNYTLDWSWHAICVLLLMALTLRFIPAHYPADKVATARLRPALNRRRRVAKNNAARSRWPSLPAHR